MTESTIIEKIRKLLDRTTDSGCTEAEAMSAAAMAAKLMDRHNLDEGDVAAGQTKASTSFYERADTSHPVCFIGGAIARFTGCMIFRRNKPIRIIETDLLGMRTETLQATKRLQIVGLEHEVAIACYLFDICYSALEGASGKALAEENNERASAREPLLYGKERLAWVHNFQLGMVSRMGKTLDAMTAERQKDAPHLAHTRGSGRDLVLVRQSLIKDWLKENGVQIGAGRKVRVGGSAFDAGKAAGVGVRFNSGVGSGQRGAALAIGGR